MTVPRKQGAPVGNRYGPRADEFDWNLGARRRLRRYLREADLSYAEAALLLGTTRGSVAGAADRFGLTLGVEEQRDRQARQSYERAQHGRRAPGPQLEARLTETWKERKRRLARPQVIAAE
jgi:hypothetical protein